MKGGVVMDAQLKRGLIDICVLSAIRYEDSYGYRIIKTVKPFIEVSESTLYPVLRRLEEAQLLSVLNAFLDEWKEITAIYNFVTREANHE